MSTATNLRRVVSRARCPGRIVALVAVALVIGPPRWSSAAATGARTFASAAEASEALFQAARNGDRHAVEAVLGSADGVASCGDESRDAGERERFVEKYQELHRLVREPDGTTVLYIGAENWPFPIPLVSKNGAWYFDSDSGKQEIMFRRVGENEATAIEVCEEFAMAKNGADAKAASEDP